MARLVKDLISFLLYLCMAPFRGGAGAVLVYHSIDDTDAAADPLKVSVSTSLFEKQMRYLSTRRGRYTVTFDDGFKDMYINAFPVLKRYGVRSILFVTPDFIDHKADSDLLFRNGRPLQPLGWDDIRSMISSGIEIGSHSLSHRNMAALDKETALHEAVASRERISAKVGRDIVSFSYPFGDIRSFNKVTERILQDAGYKQAYTNIMGMDNSLEEPFRIRRIRVYGTDGMFRFRMKVAGAYNWVDAVIAATNIFRRPS